LHYNTNFNCNILCASFSE